MTSGVLVGPVSDDVLSRFGLERPRTLRRHSFVSLSARRTPARRKRCIARNCGPVLKTRREGNGRHLQGAPETSEPRTLPPRLVRTKQSAEMTPMRFGLDQGKSGWSFWGTRTPDLFHAMVACEAQAAGCER
jgi:hypothetical protein